MRGGQPEKEMIENSEYTYFCKLVNFTILVTTHLTKQMNQLNKKTKKEVSQLNSLCSFTIILSAINETFKRALSRRIVWEGKE